MRFPRSHTFLTRRLRKRPQLSLAALLFLILLAAVLVQFAMLPMLRKRAREYALAEIANAGGQWVVLPNDQSHKRLLLSGANVDDELIEIVSNNIQVLPELVQLDLFQTQVTDEGWRAITGFNTQIERMVVFENQISEATIDKTESQRPNLTIERRKPDPVALGLAGAPIPPAAIVSAAAIDGLAMFGTGDGRLHLFDLNNQQPRRSVEAHDDWLFDFAVSPDGRRLATAGGDNELAIWSFPELQLLVRNQAHAGDLHAVVWLSDTQLATVSDDKSLARWELTDEASRFALQLRQQLTEHQRAIPRLRVSADRRSLLSASRDQQLRLWHVQQDGSIVPGSALIGHTADCMDVQFSPDGQQALSVAYDGRLVLWDLKTAQAVSEFKLADGRLFCLAVDWEDQRAIVGTETGIIDAHWGTGYTGVYNDQPFVSRVVMLGTQVYTTDGFGGLKIRRRHNLTSKSAEVQLYEKEYDHYSDDFFEEPALVNPYLLVKRR